MKEKKISSRWGNMVRKVVIVTEDDRIFAYLSSIFQEAIQSRSALDAISAIKENEIDLVIVDYKINSIGSIELMKMIDAIHSKLLAVMLIPFDDNIAELDCINNNIQRIINSGMSKELVKAYLEKWFGIAKMDSIEGTLIGASKKMMEFNLTKIELLIVASLIKGKGQIVDRNTIAEEVWHVPTIGQKLNTHVKKIRNKFKGTKYEGCLRTVHGRGFIWISNE